MCKKCFFRKPSVNDLGVIVQSKSPLPGGISWRGAVVRGYLFKENCREGKSPWRNCPGVNFMGGAIVLGVIVQEKLSRGSCAGDKSPWDCPGSNFLGTNCPGVSCPVANFSVVIVRGTKDFLQRVTLAISNKWILQQAASDFLQWTTSATSREGILPLLELN